jgi:uncharacterized protein YhhL (DUF1145 family)
MSAGGFYATIAAWGVGAIVLAIAVMYFLRPRTRAHYPGGPRRYLLAVTVQIVALLAPIPLVLLLLLSSPLPQQAQVVIAVAVGVAVLFGLRFVPFTGQLLKDLHKARVAAMVDRLERRT